MVAFGLGVTAQPVFNADPEPNNLFVNAIPIQFGVAFEGQINTVPGDLADIYSFAMPDDGVLLLEVEAEQNGSAADHFAVRATAMGDSASIVPFLFYDPPPDIGNNGIPTLSTVRLTCLRAGLHYLRVGGLPQDTTTNAKSYRITATLRPMAFADDPEPNNELAQSVPLAQGVVADGRLCLGWESDIGGDAIDMWTITKSDPGPLVVYTQGAFEGDLNDPHAQIALSDGNDSIISDIDNEGEVVFGQNGVPLADTAVFFSASAPGIYYLQWFNPAAAPCWCYRFSYTTVAVGMEEHSGAAHFSVLPNPTNGPVELRGKGFERVEVIDPSGRRVEVIPMHQRSVVRWQPEIAMDGLYLLRAFGEDGSIRTLRLAVVH